MQSTQDQVSHLLWCILIALRTAGENHNVTSEKNKRKFIAEWLSNARHTPAFQGMANEFSSIRQLLDGDKSKPIDDVLTSLWKSAVNSAGCDLFRYRAVLNSLFSKGWRHCLCPWPERIIPEVMERQRSRKRHILQLTRMEDAFSSTGAMSSPVTLQLLLQQDNDEAVEWCFYLDRFSVVQGQEIKLNKATLRTLYIGHHSLPESAWGARDEGCTGHIWRPSTH